MVDKLRMRWFLATTTWLPDNVALTVSAASGAGFRWFTMRNFAV
jgi:hypothetical protein